MKDRNVLLALAASIVSRIIVSYPLDGRLFHGSDFYGHLPVIWYISHALNLGWNYLWYTGYPVIKFVSPLSLLFGSFFALFADSTVAFKFVINVSFVLAPLAFLVLAGDFRLNDRQKAVAVLLFSFIPSGIYYFWEASFPTVLNVVFCLLLWHVAIKYMETGKLRHAAFAGVFFAIAMLVHQLTALFSAAIVFTYCIAKYRKAVIAPFIVGALISSFWLAPFLLEYTGDPIIKQSAGIGLLVDTIISRMGMVPFALICVLIAAVAAHSLKDRENRPMVAVLILMAAALFLSSYNRILFVAAAPIALVFAKMYSRKRSGDLLVYAVLAVAVIVFFSFEGFFYLGGFTGPATPDVTGRVMYYPEFVLGPTMDWQEISTGGRPQFLIQGELKGTKSPYYDKLFSPLQRSQQETHGLLRAGGFTHVAVNIDKDGSRYMSPPSKYINQTEYLEYFSGSGLFNEVYRDGSFVVFKLSGNPSYVELNGKEVDYTVDKQRNAVALSLECEPGKLLVKESYDDYWNAYVNGSPTAISVSPNGFMEVDINNSGSCNVYMKFAEKAWYAAFYVLSAVAVVALIVFAPKYWNRGVVGGFVR